MVSNTEGLLVLNTVFVVAILVVLIYAIRTARSFFG